MLTYSWLIPLAFTAYLTVWILLPMRHATTNHDASYVMAMRAGGGLPLSGAIWLIWWLW